ncbi:MAG TPA: hypothetical protein PKH93_05540 [Chitinophagales bacterium]|nr:hypothetical protein [Chitinophagales bacterium]
MRRLLYTAFLALVLTSFSACFTMTEEVTLRSNGSGSFARTVDMSQLLGMMSMFMPDSLKDSLDFSKMDFNEMTARFVGLNGISNVKSDYDKSGIITLSFDFKNLTALNSAITKGTQKDDMTKELGLDATMDDKYISKGRCIGRTASMKSDKTTSELMDMFKSDEYKDVMNMFSPPTMRIVYHLPSPAKKIKTKEKGVQVIKDGNDVTLEYNMLDMFMGKNKKVYNHSIKY